MTDAFFTIAREEGKLALFRGLPIRLIYVTPSAAVSFALYEQFKRMLRNHQNSSSSPPTFPEISRLGASKEKDEQDHPPQSNNSTTYEPLIWLTAGAAARLIGTAVRTPFDIVKQRMQVQGSLKVPGMLKNFILLILLFLIIFSFYFHLFIYLFIDLFIYFFFIIFIFSLLFLLYFKVYKNSFHALKVVFSTEGYRGLFQGYISTMMRDVPFAGLYFSSYESFKYVQRVYLLKDGNESSQLTHIHHLFAGALAGAFASVCTLPMDVVKLNIQTQNTLPLHERRFHSVFHAWKMIYATEGIPGFFKGWGPVLFKVTPAASVTFACYEAYKSYFESR